MLFLKPAVRSSRKAVNDESLGLELVVVEGAPVTGERGCFHEAALTTPRRCGIRRRVAGTAAEVTATGTAEVARLQTALDAMTAERDRYRHLYEQLREAYAKLAHGLRGQQAERLPPDDRQLTLALLGTLLGDDAPPAAQPVRAPARRPPTGRQPLPEHVPRVKIELVPLDVQRQGLDQFERIGAAVSEVLERRPASAVVVEVIRPKFVPKGCDRLGPTRVLIAEPAELPIPLEDPKSRVALMRWVSTADARAVDLEGGAATLAYRFPCYGGGSGQAPPPV